MGCDFGGAACLVVPALEGVSDVERAFLESVGVVICDFAWCVLRESGEMVFGERDAVSGACELAGLGLGGNELRRRLTAIEQASRSSCDTIVQQASTISAQDQEIESLRELLFERLDKVKELFEYIVKATDEEAFRAYEALCKAEGNQSEAARSLGLQENTLRARVKRWPSRGEAYVALHGMYQARLHGKGKQSFFDAMRQAHRTEGGADAAEAEIRELVEVLEGATEDNWHGVKAEALDWFYDQLPR